MSRKCVMGCRDGLKLHMFPKDEKRRAEWCRILGVRQNTKCIYACSRHFGKEYIFGDRVSKYAIPKDEGFKNRNNILNDDLDLTLFQYNNSDDHKTHKLSEAEIKQNVEKDPLDIDGSIRFPSEDEEESEEQAETFAKIENFEIRKRDTHGTIIKGRFVQTDKYLMVSYTPPKKWSLQEQVKRLDEHCTRQLRQLRLLNKEVNRLRSESAKFARLLPKLRFLQRHNRFLYSQLKMYKLHVKTLKKRKNGTKLKKTAED